MVGFRGKRKLAVLAIFLLPNLIGFSIFILVPIIGSLFISFTEWDLLSPPTVRRFRKLCSNPEGPWVL